MISLRTLRPSKIRSAVHKRWFLRQLSRLPVSEPGERFVDAGTNYGGWLVPELVRPDWTCYCVGIGGDISLEEYLLDRGATVRSFDPVQKFVDAAKAELAHTDRFSADCVAIAAAAGTVMMQQHHEAVSASLSAAHLYESNEMVEVRADTLSALAQRYGDQSIDLLKLDVEGLEYALVPELDLRGLGVKIFATQLHHNGSLRDARRLIEYLESRHYRLVGQRPVAKLTFAADA